MTPENKVLALTGASGLIGSSLLPVLLAKGYRLRALSRRHSPDIPGVTRVNGDIRSLDAVREVVRGCNGILHLAGIAHTSLRSQREMDETERVNVGGARNILAAAKDAGVERILLASSAHVYAGQEGTELSEQSPTAEDSFYARTKLMVERAGLDAANANGADVIIVRPCITYGPGARFNLDSLMRALHGRYYFHIRGANPLRSFLSVDNAAAAIAHLLEAGKNGEIYNLADQHPIPLADFVNSLADLMRVSRPRSLPKYAIRAAVAAAVPLRWAGVRSPLNQDSLRKLTQPFSLDVKALAASGFRWPGDGKTARKKMVDAFLLSRKGGDAGALSPSSEALPRTQSAEPTRF